MFRAIGRFFRAIGYLLTGKVDRQTERLQRDPTVIKANFARIVQEKKEQIQEYSGAVAQLLAQEEKKKQSVKRLSDELERLRNLQKGAGGKAKVRAADLKAKGVPLEQIRVDAAILQAKAAFADFGSTIEEKEARITELEGDIDGYEERIKKHKVQLQSLQRAIGKLKDEAADTVADMITATEEKQLNDALAGISADGTGEELERMRDLRNRAKAEATVASELAGTDTKQLEAEYEHFAAATQANDEFDDLLGLDETADQKMERVEERLDKSSPVTE
ncbi:MAG: PspA/IM30 family protein [Promethearchaeota archaeon]|jgi:chromosome segregation ATPase